MGSINPIKYYGRPVIGITLALATGIGAILGLGGETVRAEYATWLLLLFPHWLAIIYLVWLAFDFRAGAISLPKVKAVHLAEGFILATEKDWMGMSVSVLIYKQEGDFERLLCSGIISNIQQNRLVQIRLLVTDLETEEAQQLAARLNDGQLNTLIIKPGNNIGA